MTGRHLLKLWGGVALVGMVVVAGLLLWPLVWPEDPDKGFQLVDGRLVGETEGSVWRVESEQRRIHVTSSLVGLRAVPITVTPETKIVVSNKLGGFADIWKGMDVRVSYELRDSTRVATGVEVLTSQSRRARRTPTEIVVPADAATEPLAERALEAKKPAAPAMVPAKPAVSAAPAVMPANPPAPAPARAAAPPPNEPDLTDGTAAVDWLIKGSRR